MVLCQDGDDLVVGSSTGRLLRLEVNEENLPVMGRNAQGPVLLRLLPGEVIIGAAAINASTDFLIASKNGLIRRIPACSIRKCSRGAIGQVIPNLLQRDELLHSLHSGNCAIVATTTQSGKSARLNTSELIEEEQKRLFPAGQKEELNELIPLWTKP